MLAMAQHAGGGHRPEGLAGLGLGFHLINDLGYAMIYPGGAGAVLARIAPRRSAG